MKDRTENMPPVMTRVVSRFFTLIEPRGRGTHSRFTLIELLIVIGIIAILASILLPALNQAKEMAQRATCQNQVKQIGAAMFMYANDFEGRLPTAVKNTSGTKLCSGSGFTDRLGLLVYPYGKGQGNVNCVWKKNSSEYIPREILDCPGKRYTSVWKPWVYNYWHYCAYSYCVPLSTSNSHGSFSYTLKNLDTPMWWWGGYSKVRYHALVACALPTSMEMADQPHRSKGANVLYSDASVSWFPRPPQGWWLHPYVAGKYEGNSSDGAKFWKTLNLAK